MNVRHSLHYSPRFLLWAALLLVPVAASQASDRVKGSVAFFYGPDLPVDALVQYETVVVEPDAAAREDVARLERAGVEVFGYLSLGEVHTSRTWYQEVETEWIAGSNESWGSSVVDLTQRGWHLYVLEQRLQKLWQVGYRRFFLDTLDSFQLVSKSPAERQAQALGLAALIQSIHDTYPGVELLLNRGFEILPRVGRLAKGLVAESLFRTFDASSGKFVEVPEKDRAWLGARLEDARTKYGLEITVIDYVPAAARELARETARRIVALGYSPWVTQPALNALGVGTIESMSRRILAVYDAAESSLEESAVHMLAAPVLESFGCVIEYVSLDELPPPPLLNHYAAIISWFGHSTFPQPRLYRAWLLRQIDDGIPFVMLGHTGLDLDGDLLDRFGLTIDTGRLVKPVKIVHQDDVCGFEAKPRPRARVRIVVDSEHPENTAHLTLEDRRGLRCSPIVTGPWGGLALSPFIERQGLGGASRWIIDPFKFFRNALNLPLMPIPDLTTENGSRLLITHIDGDGSVSRAEKPGTPFAMEVVADQFLEKYPFPTTVSIIEGEVGPAGLYPQHTEELERVARRIFALDHVEMATHTYSHPFDWANAEADPESDKHRLAIPSYTYDLRREIEGSVDYINSLGPPGKKVKVVLWSGTALPTPKALEETARLGLLNLNGGDTTITNDQSSMSRVSAAMRPVGEHLQVYAPIMNENSYTNEWLGPYDGFRRVIETFELTNLPRRLKPLNIYYHFYSGAKEASIVALRTVYDWALAQQPLGIYGSRYSRMVRDFARCGWARTLDGAWRGVGFETLRTVRLPVELGWPDLGRSLQVATVADLPQGRYVTFAGDGPLELYLRSEPPVQPYFHRVNAEIVQWERTPNGFRAQLEGWSPVSMVLRGLRRGDRVEIDGRRVEPEWLKDQARIRVTESRCEVAVVSS